LLNILRCVSEFERSLINERTQGGLRAYQKDFEAGRIGNGARSSKSGKNLRVGGHRRIFDRSKVIALRADKKSIRQIASILGISIGTVSNVLAEGVQRTGLEIGAAQSTFSGVTEANAAVQ